MFSHCSSIFFPEIQSVMRFSQFNTRPGSNFKVNLLPKYLLCAMAIRQNSGKRWSFPSTLRVIQTSKHLTQNMKSKKTGKKINILFFTAWEAWLSTCPSSATSWDMNASTLPNPNLSQKKKSSFVKPSHWKCTESWVILVKLSTKSNGLQVR